MRWLRRWWEQHDLRRFTHRHFEVARWGVYEHAHEWPFADHGHELDLPCISPACDRFDPHRLHPRPGPRPLPR